MDVEFEDDVECDEINDTLSDNKDEPQRTEMDIIEGNFEND